jgi:hypothetical protein
VRIDPTVLDLGRARLDAEQHDEPRSRVRHRDRVRHGRDERAVVRNVVIGWEDRDRHVARQLPNSQQWINDPGSGPGVSRLFDETIGRQLGRQTSVIRFVRTADDDHVLIGSCDELRASAGSVEQRLAVQDVAELLGPRISSDLPGQRLETAPISSGQQQRPWGRWDRTHAVPL